ncbi:MAG: bifunctional 4-hydroxy-2-oxoglutarate aldolase/2-dehydro-3-deoxy-phosphogluconate aldolase [Spirochaetales bacterium]|uniref:2-dehydro-3-deoxy-phosphogluconate aldolase n=1 Tax=Candidatus Thalassospirochaeta sargassi TaxID=3119039 RepID=A0AAJ1MLV6_9SPIO|nr:bifunctional 4-hydroxy-2-oxoglutarate aldolase/2-dehydro-3-deoxy-phosphogluconate aldolase [Spirochaetales bacterium]
MSDIFETIGRIKLVPVVKIENAKDAPALGNALSEGGLPIAEVTFRTAAAEEAIKLMKAECKDMLIGAGTVLTVENAQKAIDAGASFIVSPGFNPEVVDFCIAQGMPVTPGVTNPTQVEMGLSRGLKVLKFFPAEAAGGLKMLKSMGAVYDCMYMPTGGINASNLKEYLAYDKILACGGSWMVKADLISSGNFAEITRLTKEAMELTK